MAEVAKGVKAQHPDYTYMLPEWTKCRDLIEGGTRRLREKSSEYLASFYEEDPQSYSLRVKNTVLTNFSYRTLVGYKGMLVRKLPVITVPATITPLLEDVTLSGIPLEMFIGEVIEEVLCVGRVGIWTNYPEVPEGVTMADSERLNLRPSLHLYKAESVDNWAHRRINNKYVLSMVKIKETRAKNLDEYTVEEEDVYRVLDLVDMVDGSVAYRVRLIKCEDGKDGLANIEVTLEEHIPIMDGKPLDHIPFDFIGPDDTESDVDAPPFVDLVDVNLVHWTEMSAYLNGCFFSGIPQAWIAGVELKPGEKLRLGGTAWVFPNPNAKAQMLEIGSSGYIGLKDLLKMLEDHMLLIGSRLLEVQHPGGTEGPVTATIHLSGEHSVLAGIGQTISIGITRRLKDFVQWAGQDSSNTSCTLTKYFFDTPLTPQARDSIVKSWQAGAISDQAKFDLLKGGSDYAPNVTFEDEQKAIEASSVEPAAPTNPTIPPQGEPNALN